jgi:hypothetical protein
VYTTAAHYWRVLITHDVDYAIRSLLRWMYQRGSVAVRPVDQDALAYDRVGESSGIPARSCVDGAIKHVLDRIDKHLLKAHDAVSEFGLS